jgi:phosphoribosylanthranilate isomerase
MMFRVKICGITNVEDALVAAAAGADAIGLNFYERSPRYVDAAAAKVIAARVPNEIAKVGVFVNMSAADICDIVREVPLGWIQLHGDEPPELLADLPDGVQIIRAQRCEESGLRPLAGYLVSAAAAGRSPDAILIDGPAKATFGGAGQLPSWRRIVMERDILSGLPLVLAGGLAPDNVAEAIRFVRPAAVDVASGVEHRAGKKDPDLVKQFVHRAAIAFAKADSAKPA